MILAQVNTSSGEIQCSIEFATPSALPYLPDHLEWVEIDAPFVRQPTTPTAVPKVEGGRVVWVETEDLADARRHAWDLAKAERTAAELAPFEFDGQLYDADVARVSGAALNALMAQLAGVPFSVDWTLADNTVRTLDATQTQAMGRALAMHIETAFGTARAMREAIAAAETPAAAYAAAAWPTLPEDLNV